MSDFKTILTQIDTGEPAPKIAVVFPWVSIHPEDREALFIEAETRGHNGDKLIQVLSYLTISQSENKWDKIRSASLNFRFLPWDETRKRKILQWMDNVLEDIRRSIKEKPEDIQRYRLFRADIEVLNAGFCLEIDNINDALICYQEALTQYKECGALEKVAEVSKQIEIWNRILSNQEQVLPIDQYKSQRLRFSQELAKFHEREKKLTIDEENIIQKSKEYERLRRDTERKKLEVEKAEKEFILKQQQLKSEITNEEMKKKKIEDDIQHFLDFLKKMHKLSTSPLWVEVIRLSLMEGKIDNLTKQAAIKLARSFPDEKDVDIVITELFMRSSDPLDTEALSFLNKSKNWMAKISQAEEIMDVDIKKAAQLLIEAWETYLNNYENE